MSQSKSEMTGKQQEAYDEALRRIKEYGREDNRGSLNLGDLGLTKVPPEIGQLTALRELLLHRNQIRSLPPEIGQLRALIGLRLDSNQLRSLPPEIGQLRALSVLWLQNNKLSTLPPEIGQLNALRCLYVGLNQLSSLPSEIRDLRALEEFDLKGNPGLKLPPSLSPNRPSEVLDYYFATRGTAGQALREVKVILVGRGEVGKSSMVDVLTGKGFVKGRERTDGIAITSWVVKLKDGEAELALWDFGGQEIMHGTHQFFLTHRSLYVVMVDGRHDRGRQDAEYWLKLVRAFGGESPVLVVMNRQKAHPFDVDRELLAQKHGVKLEHFFRTDCEDKASIKPVREAILVEAGRMLAAEERFPASCWELKTRLSDMKKRGEDYLSEADYQKLCLEHGVNDEKDQQKLLRRLADLGTVVSFPDDLRMSALSVLNPEWATDGIYRVVTNGDLREKCEGVLKPGALRDLLPVARWPKDLHVRYVQDLMTKFDLCFPLEGDGGSLLVPELLPDQTPPLADWDAAKCVVFQYQYPVLPHGVLPRFITRTHQMSAGRLRWRSGVVLADDGAEARVQGDYDANTLSIWVRGRHSQARRELLKVIRHHFENIHARIEGLNPDEKVAVPGNPEVLLNYRDVLLDERRGKTEFPVTVKGVRRDWPIDELLNGIATRAERFSAAWSEGGRPAAQGFINYGTYIEKNNDMSNTDDHSINIGGDNFGQVGQTLTNCTNMIQQQGQGEVKTLLEALEKDVKALLPKLPEDKQEEAAGNLELMVKAATAAKPNRKWWEVSAEGLIEASKFVKDFGGNIAGTVGKLGKVLGVG